MPRREVDVEGADQSMFAAADLALAEAQRASAGERLGFVPESAWQEQEWALSARWQR
jgi:hypothetical protein